MERKLNDLFMDKVASPDASYLDFVNVGYTPENTSLQDISVYKNNDWVRDHFKDLYGNFNEGAFQETYDAVQSMYNDLAVQDREKFIRSQISYHRDNIHAPRELRRQGPDFLEVKMTNPYRQVYGLTTLGRVEDPVMSIDEIAQSNKVLANPTTAGADLSNAKWEDTPNGNFGKYFWDTLVLALYDEDGEHIDPISGQKIKHSKGELKLNEDGEFYYEKLDGRSIYGRQVLNKANILTVDGTPLNKYDFFDSDDLELKSIAGSVLKNAALVGSMFIPYIGPAVLTATLATLAAGIAATFGKMLIGSDSPTLSAIEGWSASMDRRRAKTQYAQEHPWCWESFITMIGDFTEIGATLRFLFSKVPQLIMGKDLMTEEGYASELNELIESEKALAKTKVNNLIKASSVRQGEKGWQQLQKNIYELENDAVISAMARVKLQPLVEQSQTIGHTLAKGYMALSIANDMYGEAKTQGASDLDATLLTLGYTAGLYGFLNAGVSQWIFPELRAEGYRAQAIAKALVSKDKEVENLTKLLGIALKSFDKKAKKDYVKRIFNVGKKIANAEYANGTKTLSATVAAGVGMGVEGMGFEFLSDLSRGCYDLVKWLQGESHRMDTFGYNFETNEWNPGELALGYGSNFLSAVAGGTITGFFGTYKAMRNLNNITRLQAIQEVIYMARNDKLPQFLKLVDKMELGNKYLSTTVDPRTNNFLPGTEDNNQDLANKTAIRSWAKQISDILNAHGANLSDESFLDILTLKELRFAVLQRSPLAGLYLDEFNTALSELVRVTSTLNEKNLALLDKNKNGRIEDSETNKTVAATGTETEELIKLKGDLDRLATLVQDLVSGKRSYEFIYRTMYDLTSILSMDNSVTNLQLWCYVRYGKRYEDLSNIDKDKALSEYKTWMETEGRESTRDAADISHQLSLLSSKTITDQVERYINSEKRTTELRELNHVIQRLLLPEAQSPNFDFLLHEIQLSNIPSEEWINIAQDRETYSKINTEIALIENLSSDEVKKSIKEKRDKIESISKEINKAREENRDEKEIKSLDNNLNAAKKDLGNYIDDVSHDYISNYVLLIVDLGYASTELKNQVTNTLNDFKEKVYTVEHNKYVTLLLRLKDSVNNIQEELVQLNGEEQKEALNGLDTLNTLINNAESDLAKIDTNSARVDELITKLNELNESPLVHNLDEFLKLVAGSKNRVVIEEVLKEVNDIYNRTPKDISRFNLDDDLQRRLQEALSIMRLYRATITAARTDNVGINNLYGYNATLNEIAEKMGVPDRLATIDSSVADVFIEDLNTNISKLEYLNKLNILNQGSKLNSASRISNRKDLLIYKRISSIFNNVDPTDSLSKWSGLTELQSKINDMNKHQELLKKNSFIVDKENEEAFEREKISLEDAIYDFFNANSDKDLTELINPNRLSLIEPVNDVLDETIENFSDNSMVWWLRDRAALKSSDFYSQFVEVISTEGDRIIIPTAALEMGVYQNYASIVNGKLCDKFNQAYIDSVIKYWKGLSVDERKEILKKFTENIKNVDNEKIEEYASDLMADFIINIIPLPKYKNGNFIEGIPGAGKSDGIYYFTIKLLQKFHPEILENAIIIHGGTQESAQELCEKLGLKNVKGIKTFGPQEWMDFVGLKDKVPSIDPTTRKIKIKDGDISTSGEYNKLIPTFKTRDFKDEEKPKLIIVDEAQRINYFLMSSIEQIAEKLGISFIAAGDLNQTGINIDAKISTGSINGNLTLNVQRTEFARTPKVGTSMRTDNIVKTRNLNAMRLHMENPDKTDPVFEYMLNDEGLFGDKVLIADGSETMVIDPEFKKTIDLLVKTKKPNEKIGYITNVENSAVFKYLSENYKDAFDLKTMDAASGKEAQYYIIETYDPDDPNFFNDIYTGMSRAEQGSIILVKNGETRINDKRVDTNIKEPLSESAKKIYTIKRKTLLSKIVKPGATTEIIPRDTSELILTIPTTTVKEKVDKIEPPAEPPAKSPTEPPAPISTSKEEEGFLFSDKEMGDTVKPITNIPDTNNENLVKRNQDYKEGYLFLDSDGGIKGNDDEFKNNENTLTVNAAPTIRIKILQLDNLLGIDLVLFTFHMFGIGMEVNGDEIVILDPSEFLRMFKARIDGANGLIKMMFPSNITDEQILKNIKNISVKTIDNHIAKLTSYIYNYGNKELLLGKIRKYLEINFPDFVKKFGTENLFIDFAFKQSPIVSTRSRESNINTIELRKTPFTLNVNEKNRYSHVTDPRGDEFPSKKFVAIIGRKIRGKRYNLLELPLFGISSPLTIMQLTDDNGHRYFEDIFEYYEQVRNRITNSNPGYSEEQIISICVKEIIKEFDKKLDDKLVYPQYRSLINLFKVFDYGFRDLTYIATDKNGNFVPVNPKGGDGKYLKRGSKRNFTGADLIERILDESTWTPFDNLKMLGARLMHTRGLYLISPDFIYKSSFNPNDWVEINEYLQDPRVKATSLVYISRTGESEDMQIVEKGHPFILVSYDLDIANDKQMIDYYVEQRKNPNLQRKVDLIYVIPPAASAREYINNLKTIFTTKSENRPTLLPIGLLFTSYRLVSNLLSDDRVINFLKNESQYTPGLIQDIKNILETLSKLGNKEISEELLSSELVDKLIKKQEDRRKFRLVNEGTSLASYFDSILLDICYQVDPDNTYHLNEAGMKLIEGVLPYGIRYNSKVVKNSNEYRGLLPVTNVNDYTINGKQYLINGKIDSVMFLGNLDPIFDIFLNFGDIVIFNNASTRLSFSQDFYLTHTHETYGYVSDRVLPEEIKGSQTSQEEISLQPQSRTLNLANDHVPVEKILQKLKINEESTPISMSDGVNSVDALNDDMIDDGVYKFKLKVGDKTYDAEFDDTKRLKELRLKEENCGADVKLITIKL